MGALPDVGKKLGSGVFRAVYEYGPNRVIKVNRNQSRKYVIATRSGGDKANEREWQVWQAIQGTTLQPYFVHAFCLTPAGDLIVERASCTFDQQGCRSKVKLLVRKRIEALAEALDLFDVFRDNDNMGLAKGLPKILDYQMLDLRRLSSGIRLVEGWTN